MSEVARKQEAREVAARSDIPIGPRGIQVTRLSELNRLAHAMVVAGIAPKGMDAPTACAVMLKGMEVGFSAIDSLASICCINGRFSLWGDGIQSIILSSGLLAQAPEEFFEGEGEDLAAVCRLWRKGWTKPVERRYSVQDAKAAGLLGKDNWRHYLTRMLRWRAYNYAARDAFSDVLKGLQVREVAEDDGDFSQPQPCPAPTEVPYEDKAEAKALGAATKAPAPETKAAEAETRTAEPETPFGYPPKGNGPPKPLQVFGSDEAPAEVPTVEPEKLPDYGPDQPNDADELWAIWEDLRPRLSAAQLGAIRDKTGVGRIAPNLTLDNLRAVVIAAQEELGTEGGAA